MLACSTWLLTMQSVRSLGLFFGRMWNLELPSVEGPRETSERIQLVAIRSMVVPAGSNVRVWKRWPGSIGCAGSLPFCLITGLGGATVGTLQPCAAAVAASSWALTGFHARLLHFGFRSRFLHVLGNLGRLRVNRNGNGLWGIVYIVLSRERGCWQLDTLGTLRRIRSDAGLFHLVTHDAVRTFARVVFRTNVES